MFRWLLPLILILPAQLHAQKMLFSEMNDRMNLPSTECYKIRQDSKGYIWIATELGLCRYDGRETIVYDEKNGLPEKAVYGISENKEGVWAITPDSRLITFKNDKIVEKRPKVDSLREKFFNMAYGLQSLGGSRFLVSYTYGQSYVFDTETGKTVQICSRFPDAQYAVSHDSRGFLPGYIFRQRIGMTTKTLYLTYVRNGKRWKTVDIPIDQSREVASQIHTATTKNASLVALKNLLIEFRSDGTVKTREFPNRILSMYVDSENNLWLSFLADGIHFYKSGNLSEKPVKSLQGYSVSDIFRDMEGSVWAATLQKGVFKCINPDILSYSSVTGLDQRLSLLYAYENVVYATSSNTGIYKIRNDSIALRDMSYVHSASAFSMLYFTGRNAFLSGSDYLLRADRNLANGVFLKSILNSTVQGIAVTAYDGEVYNLTNGHIGHVVGNNTIGYARPFTSRSCCFLAMGKNTFLRGSDAGLEFVRIVNDSLEPHRIAEINAQVKALYRCRNGGILVVTKGEGLYFYRDGKAFSVNKALKLEEKLMFDVLEDRNGRIWIASNNGVLRLSYTDGKWLTEHLSTARGLPDKEVFRLAEAHGRIYFSTPEGLISVPSGMEIYNYKRPLIHFRSLKVNGKPENFTRSGDFAYDHNTLKFSFDILSHNNPDQRIVYSIAGQENTIEGNTIILQNLESGTYDLVVCTLNEYGLKSAPLVYRLTVQPPFWRSGIFYILVTFLVCFAVFGVIIFFRKRSERKNRIAALLAESRLTAIQSQMNPHFIFNSINSIQNYILKNRKEDAYDYLVKFSKLIRLVLNNSRKTLVFISDELEILNLYVELEQIRLRNSFSFRVTLDESLDADDIKLPAMVIQPLLENAIWHGITPLKGIRHGELHLSFTTENDMLKISVRDNGVGRKQAGDKDKAHVSLGMQLIHERLALVDDIYGKSVNMKISDCYDENRKPSGTLVELFLPL